MDFLEFSLHEDLQKGITAAGYVTCTPVQEQVLKTALNGDDLYVQSQTGTGKTAAYLVSIAQELLTRPEVAGKKVLILMPTRELAVQVEDEAKKLLQNTKLTAFSFYGGVGYDKQVAALKNGVDVLIGTPGRIIDLIKGGQMSLKDVGFLVIDEADRMFDMGFYPDLRTLLEHLPQAEDRQTMLFSATLNSYVKNLAWEYSRDAKEITIAAENITVSEIDQELFHVSSDEKMKLLIGILQREKPASAIIFCNTKRGCEVLGKRLKLNGFESDFLIGDMPQVKRLKVLENFKAGKVPMLVATDVAARGIDVSDLAMVVNYDLPNEAENYVHRIGRTARAGKSGKAYTFCSEQDVYNLPAIERFIEMQIPSRVADETLFGDDKSAGIYIRTENWHEDSYGADSDRRRDDSRSHTRRDDSRGSGRRDSRSSGRYSDRNTDRRSSSRYENKDGRSSSRYEDGARKNRSERNDKKFDSRSRTARPESAKRENFSNLENLSFDERMKLYKEKYAASAPSGKAGGRSSYKNKNYRGSKRYDTDKRQNQRAGKQYAKGGRPSAGQQKSVQKKQGIFSKILSIFGGRK